MCIRQRIGGSNPPLTAIFKEELVRRYGLFFRILHTPGDEKPRPGFDNWRQPVGQTVNAVSGLPAGRAKRVNPPLTAIFKEELVRRYGLFFRILHTPGDEKPRPGFDNWRQPVGQTVNAVSGLPAGRAKRVNPPLTAIFKEELVRRYGLFFRILHTLGPPPRPSLLGRGVIVHINCLVAQSTIKMRKRVQNIYALSGHFLSLPHLLKCPQRKYMSHAIIKSLCQRNRQWKK